LRWRLLKGIIFIIPLVLAHKILHNFKNLLTMKQILRLALLLTLFARPLSMAAQVAINADGSAPNASAMLDVSSTNKGFLPPRMTNDQIKAIPSPPEGMLAYDTDFKCLRLFTGTQWQCQQAANEELNDPPGDFSILATATGSIFPQSTTTDASGNVYVTGYFYSPTAIFGSTILLNNGISDVFVVKYNSSGVVQWAVNVGGSFEDKGSSIAVDGSGNVYITGYFYSNSILGLTNTGNSDVFVVKYNSSGVGQWAVAVGGSLSDYGNGIAVDGSGNVYITGNFYSNTLLGLTNTGDSDFFVVKYNSSGVVQWAVNGGGFLSDSGSGIAVDGSGNVYVTGYFYSNSVLGLINAGNSDVFVVKYNSSGVVQWAVSGGGSSEDKGSGIAVDGSGNVYITGNTYSNILGLTNNGISDVFVVKYNSSGVVQWAAIGGGAFEDKGSGIAVDGSGNVYITGYFSSATANFGSTVLLNTGNSDVFVAKYNSSGVVQWAVKGGGTSNDYGNGVAVNTSGTRVYTVVNYNPNAKFGNTVLKTGSYFLWMYGE
jgi:Beta-propeller repeat